PPFGRTRQHPRSLVVGAQRAGTRGGTGTGRPARPVVDRHRPGQRNGPVPDHPGQPPRRDRTRPPSPGTGPSPLVGLPPGRIGAAWSAFHLGDFRRAAPLVADGIACTQRAGEPQLEAWGRNLLAVLAWHAGDADRIVAEIEASRVLSGQADPALAARAQNLLA